MAKAKQSEPDAREQSPGGLKKSLLLIIGALLLIAASIGGTLLVMGDRARHAEQPKPLIAEYLALNSMVVNFAGNSPVRYLQLDIQLMAYDKAPLQAVVTHMPVIRNNILMLLSTQQYNVISTREGKEQLRSAILAGINQVLEKQAKIPPEKGINAVYFTSFVMQ